MTIEELTTLIKGLESQESANLILADGSTWEVGYADCWLGGESCKGWMCDVLGNTYYTSARELATEILKWAEKQKIEIIDYD